MMAANRFRTIVFQAGILSGIGLSVVAFGAYAEPKDLIRISVGMLFIAIGGSINSWGWRRFVRDLDKSHNGAG
jgi:hypothetical protein